MTSYLYRARSIKYWCWMDLFRVYSIRRHVIYLTCSPKRVADLREHRSKNVVFPSPGGLMNTWKRRWCVLKDETFLWFRAKQEALKQGWLHKKGGGSSTLSRRNWKRRWFVLRQSKLMYFENDGEDKMKGLLEIHHAK